VKTACRPIAVMALTPMGRVDGPRATKTWGARWRAPFAFLRNAWLWRAGWRGRRSITAIGFSPRLGPKKLKDMSGNWASSTARSGVQASRYSIKLVYCLSTAANLLGYSPRRLVLRSKSFNCYELLVDLRRALSGSWNISTQRFL
jgi:hypothetical protein